MTLQQKIQQTELIADAIQRHDKNYTLDVKNDNTWINTDTINLELPTPQRCGTSIQQRSYATDKAKEILEGLER
jgi:hypothetical protein